MSLPYIGVLLSGPFVQILHDEKRDGSFLPLTQGRSLPMLTYFSSTIRQQFPADGYSSHQPWPQPYPHPSSHQPAPTAVRLVGGQGRSIIDLVEWMTECCRNNAVIPLRPVVNCPVRHILAMDAIEKLGIERLSHELPQMISRLRYELFDVHTVGRILAAGSTVLPQIMDAVCLCVARYFFHGSLPEVDRWMSLARLNTRFDQGVRDWLDPRALQEGPDILGAADLWQSKVPSSYPAAWHQPILAEPPLQLPIPPAPNSWSDSGMHQPSVAQPSVPHYPIPSMDTSNGYRYNHNVPNVPQPASAYTTPPVGFPFDYSHGHAIPYAAQPPPSAPGPSQPPPLPPKPDAYHPAYVSYQPFQQASTGYEPQYANPPTDPRYHHLPPPVPDYTVRCSYCQEIYPQSAAAAHQCRTDRAYTISDSTSPPASFVNPRRRSRSARRGRSLSQEDAFRGRSMSQYDHSYRGRSPSQHNEYSRRRASTPYPRWDPAYESPRPGEYLRERQQIGPDHFVQFFVDEYGRERVVNKGGDMATEERPW